MVRELRLANLYLAELLAVMEDKTKTVPDSVEYVLIGAGLPRTGTFSTFTGWV